MGRAARDLSLSGKGAARLVNRQLLTGLTGFVWIVTLVVLAMKSI